MGAPALKILVTAGPTRERIDPVRFITNASSGRMGYAVAAEAAAAADDDRRVLEADARGLWLGAARDSGAHLVGGDAGVLLHHFG